MFNRQNKEESHITPSYTKSESTQIKTLISEGCRFEGNLFSPSNARIDGLVTGNLSGENTLLIGEKGVIKGDISAVEVTIYGNVTGNIKSHKLELKGSSRVFGDADVEHIVIEYGAKFNGKLIMREDNNFDNKDAFDLPEKEL
jgi:cytoskeletal protein CcmA (bactofilin family)